MTMCDDHKPLTEFEIVLSIATISWNKLSPNFVVIQLLVLFLHSSYVILKSLALGKQKLEMSRRTDFKNKRFYLISIFTER